jgi:imidazolonepropionase-like amidohydrolase
VAETVWLHTRLIDGTGRDPVDDAWVRTDGERITAVGTGATPVRDAEVVDCAGRTLLPGLIDCHVHLTAVDMLHKVAALPRPVLAARTFAVMKETLEAGFTTVRDAGFTEPGFRQAVEQGLVAGPRMFLATGPLTQTGGHGDPRPPHDDSSVPATDGLLHPGLVVDGADQCRRGARDLLRRGADQLKVMAGGGCASPADDVTHTQFTVEELAAVVHEARARHTYVMAHAYIPEAIANCVEAGVRTVEHANMVDEEQAAAMAAAGTYAVPTVATYELLSRDGAGLGMPADQVAKIDRVLAKAYDGLAILRAAGVRIGSGSDLLGAHQPEKALELGFKSRVLGPMAAIVAATSTNASILRRPDLGRVAEGALADLLLVDGDPLDDIGVLRATERLHLVVQGGAVAADRRPGGQ